MSTSEYHPILNLRRSPERGSTGPATSPSFHPRLWRSRLECFGGFAVPSKTFPFLFELTPPITALDFERLISGRSRSRRLEVAQRKSVRPEGILSARGWFCAGGFRHITTCTVSVISAMPCDCKLARFFDLASPPLWAVCG